MGKMWTIKIKMPFISQCPFLAHSIGAEACLRVLPGDDGHSDCTGSEFNQAIKRWSKAPHSTQSKLHAIRLAICKCLVDYEKSLTCSPVGGSVTVEIDILFVKKWFWGSADSTPEDLLRQSA